MCTANSALKVVQMSRASPVWPVCSGDGRPVEPAVSSSSSSSSCSSDCVSAADYSEPLAQLSPPRALVPFKPFDPGPSAEALPTTSMEMQLIIQNRLLKSTLIRTLERLQTQMENSSKIRQLLKRLLELRKPEQAPSVTQQTNEKETWDVDRAELYRKYEALVKQNYQLEQALLQSTGQMAPGGGGDGGGSRSELEDFRAMAKLQMSTMHQDWQEERAEKERALALNAQLHQQVEQLQHQLEQLQRQQQQLPPKHLSEPFETLDPSDLTTGGSWGPLPTTRPPSRPMLPPPGAPRQPNRFQQILRRSSTEVRTRGLGPARSVDEVLSTPYEAIQAAPLPPPGRRPPVESDRRRPAPLVPRDSGYSDLLTTEERSEAGAAAPLLSGQQQQLDAEWTDLTPPGVSCEADRLRRQKAAWREQALTGDSEWTLVAGPDRLSPCPQPRSETRAAARDSALPDEYAATNTTNDVACPHCGAPFSGDEHLAYLNHVEECPARRPRRARPRHHLSAGGDGM